MNSFGEPLPEHCVDILKEVYQLLGFEQFILYGGTALDSLLDKDCKVHDLDIAVNSVDPRIIDSCYEKLVAGGYEILAHKRPYFINITEPVTLIYATNKWLFDVAFLEHYESIGQFDLGSLYWRYPQNDVVDRYNVFNALKIKTLTPIRGLDKENPYLLTGIFLNLCAKYDLNIYSNVAHLNIVRTLVTKMHTWNELSEFHGPIAKASCVSAIFRAILRARDRITFLSDVTRSGILEGILPDLQDLLQNGLLTDTVFVSTITTIKDKSALITYFSSIAAKVNAPDFIDKLDLLKIRTWDNEDLNAFQNTN